MARQSDVQSSLPPHAEKWSSSWNKDSKTLTATLSRDLAPEIRDLTVDLSYAGGNITVEGITPNNQTNPILSGEMKITAHTKLGAQLRFGRLARLTTIQTSPEKVRVTQEPDKPSPFLHSS